MDYSPFNLTIWSLFLAFVVTVWSIIRLFSARHPNYPGDIPHNSD